METTLQHVARSAMPAAVEDPPESAAIPGDPVPVDPEFLAWLAELL